MGLKSVMDHAGTAVLKAMGTLPPLAQRDLLDTLQEEHQEVKGLLEDLAVADTAAQRRALVKKIKYALIPHTKAEEKVLYATIIALKDKNAQINGHEGNLEHDLAAKTLQKLGSIANVVSTEHKATAKVLKELVEHHIQEEEKNLWADARRYFSDEERVLMNQRYLVAKGRVKVL